MKCPNCSVVLCRECKASGVCPRCKTSLGVQRPRKQKEEEEIEESEEKEEQEETQEQPEMEEAQQRDFSRL